MYLPECGRPEGYSTGDASAIALGSHSCCSNIQTHHAPFYENTCVLPLQRLGRLDLCLILGVSDHKLKWQLTGMRERWCVTDRRYLMEVREAVEELVQWGAVEAGVP